MEDNAKQLGDMILFCKVNQKKILGLTSWLGTEIITFMTTIWLQPWGWKAIYQENVTVDWHDKENIEFGKKNINNGLRIGKKYFSHIKSTLKYWASAQNEKVSRRVLILSTLTSLSNTQWRRFLGLFFFSWARIPRNCSLKLSIPY